MLPLVRPITLRRIGEHRLRAVMTAVGIALGVAVLVAVVTVNRGIIGSFTDTLDRISGKVHLEVRGGDTGLDEALLDNVAGVDGVRFVTPIVERTLDVADGNGEALAILGLNFTEDPKALQFLYNLDKDDLASRRSEGPKQANVKPGGADDDFDDPMALLDTPRQLIVTEAFASKYRKKKGESIDLMTPEGRQAFTIYSVVQAQGPLKAFGGNLALMDYMDAQEVFGLRSAGPAGLAGRVDRFDVAVRDPEKPGELARVTERLRLALGGKFEVERPGKRQQRQEQLLKSFKLALTVGAGVALIVGMFLIYHTLSISVAQRRSEIGILRAAGATRRQIVQLFTFEGALFGLAGSLLGLGLGAVLARGMMQQSAASISEIYVRVHIDEAQVPPWVLVFGVVVGTACSALASLVPAWRASRLSPVETIRSVAYDFQGVPSLRPGWREGAALTCFALVPLVAQLPAVAGFPFFGLFSMFLVVLGATMAGRWVVLASNRVLGPVAARLFGIEGRLAADNVTRGAAKAAVTVASLMVGLSMVMGSAIMTNSFRASIDTWIEQSVPADLFVTSNSAVSGIKNQPLAPGLADDIAKLPGVAAVDRVRLRNVDYETSRILLLSLDTRIRFDQHGSWPISRWVGDRKTVISRLQAGEGVIISETFAHRFGRQPGQVVQLQTAEGRREFLILAAIIDYSSDQGAVFLDRQLYLRLWKDDQVDTFEPYLKPGADAEAVRTAIVSRWGKQYKLFVLTNKEFREEIGRMISRIFSVTRALEFVTIFISLLSVVNTLLTAILDRMREIGVLRAIGMLRGQLTRMILIESLCLALIGAAMGVLVGAVNGVIILRVVNTQDTGWQVPIEFPWDLAAIYALALVAVGVVAALYPSRVASRVPVVEALGYE